MSRPKQKKSVFMACRDSEGPDQTRHWRNLIRAFTVLSQNHCILKSISMKSKGLGPVVQSVISLTSSLVVKMLTVLASMISNSKVFLLKKCE